LFRVLGRPKATPGELRIFSRGFDPLVGMATLIIALSTTLFGSTRPSSAIEMADRFLELSTDRDTTTYDLSTVQIIVPGKFTVIKTTIDDPDVMTLELTALELSDPTVLNLTDRILHLTDYSHWASLTCQWNRLL
jgi:hypothetical protein